MGSSDDVTAPAGTKPRRHNEKDAAPKGVRRSSNLAYRADARSGHFLDVIWTREPLAPIPVLFYFNSGSFHRSNRSRAADLCSIIAKRDIVVINCEFRDLGRGTDVAGQVEDLAELIKWVVNNSNRYQLDLDRVYAAGSSYGALMAFWMALLCNTKRFPATLGKGEMPFRIRGLGLFNGMTDTESGDRIMRSISKSIARVETTNKDLAECLRPWTNHDLRTLPPVYQVTGESDSARPDIMRMDTLLERNAVAHDILDFDAGIRMMNGFMEDHASSNECARAISRMFVFFADNQ